MPRKKKKFIDKNSAVKFSVVYRSQKDPLLPDEKATERVLLEHPSKRKEEQRKYGVFWDDDYDYMQHLKAIDDKSDGVLEAVTINNSDDKRKIQLPSSVFASSDETEVGLLNRAAPVYGPRLDLDPDIVAALDGDPSGNEELEDDFVFLAKGLEGEPTFDDDLRATSSTFQTSDNDQFSDTETLSNDDASGNSLGQVRTYSGEETKSRFTEYSLTSSVMRRNEALTLLDDRFERLYEEYEDVEIGPLDCDDMEVGVDPNSDLFKQMLDEVKTMNTSDNSVLISRPKILDSDSEEEAMEDIVIKEENPEEKWDCESFLSTYSNIYNHPTSICEPDSTTSRQKKNTSCLDSSDPKGLTYEQISREFNSAASLTAVSHDPELFRRSKNETSEEKKLRKQNIKELRRERRAEKKANKLAFKAEDNRQKRLVALNTNTGMVLS